MKYVEKIIKIKTEEDKDACLRFLTMNHNILTLCQGFYTAEYLKIVIEQSDALIYYISQENQKDIVAFALVKLQSKKKGKILNILLPYAIPDKKDYSSILVDSLQNYAMKYNYPFLYVSPRIPELCQVFIEYGFESIYRSVEGNEVFEKEIEYIDEDEQRPLKN